MPAHSRVPEGASRLSPDRRLVVTGASDGIVRVWDGETLDMLDQVQVLGQAQGVAFLDDRRIAVTLVGATCSCSRSILGSSSRRFVSR